VQDINGNKSRLFIFFLTIFFIPKKAPSTDVTKKVFIRIQSGTEEKFANIMLLFLTIFLGEIL